MGKYLNCDDVDQGLRAVSGSNVGSGVAENLIQNCAQKLRPQNEV